MTALRYFGRNSDSSNAGTHIVMDKGGVDDVYGSAKVDAAYVNTALQFATTSLATVSYVTGQDNLRAKTADVLAADTAHVPLTDLAGVSGGVVPVSPNSITVPDNRVPATIKVSRNPVIRSLDNLYLTSNQVLSAPIATKQFKAASVTIADPGYPYIPLPFAIVQGGAVGSSEPSTRSMTTTNYGQLSVLDPDDVRYGWAVCDSRKVLDFHTCIPYAVNGINPTSRPLVTGSLTLNLWLGLYGGTTYTFTPTGLTFYVICYPGL